MINQTPHICTVFAPRPRSSSKKARAAWQLTQVICKVLPHVSSVRLHKSGFNELGVTMRTIETPLAAGTHKLSLRACSEFRVY